jgi:plasmid stabilization system protein ParE
MSFSLVFRPEVRQELDEAYRWYEDQQPGLGDDFLDCVDEKINQIQQTPKLYAIVRKDIRRAVIQRFPYVIYYRLVLNRIISIGSNARSSES